VSLGALGEGLGMQHGTTLIPMSRTPDRFRLMSETPDRGGRNEEKTMKYMIAMFGSASEMGQTRSPEWITEMITFMIDLDERLRASGEMVYNEGLADGSAAKTVRLENGQPVATDGPFAEAKESIIGFWIVDVASEERAIELCGEIAEWSGVVELRPVPAGPPEQ
jgi:hypothetical protein